MNITVTPNGSQAPRIIQVTEGGVATVNGERGNVTITAADLGALDVSSAASSVTAQTSFGAASNAGAATTYSRGDHTHGTPTLPTASTSTAGVVQLDGTPTDILSLGTQAAGSTGKAADAGHVHPTTGVLPTAGGTMSGAVTSARGAATDVAYAGSVSGDAFDRVRILESGQIEVGSGAAAREVILGRTAANQLSLTTSDFRIATAGRGLMVAEGSNAKMGVATLAAGAATVSTTAVTATSRIFLTNQALGGTAGFLRVSARTAGTSFTISSSSGTDTSTVAWMIVEPA